MIPFDPAIPGIVHLFAAYLRAAGLPVEQVLDMADDFAAALKELGAGASPEAIAANPARFAQPLGDDALFARLMAEARGDVSPP